MGEVQFRRPSVTRAFHCDYCGYDVPIPALGLEGKGRNPCLQGVYLNILTPNGIKCPEEKQGRERSRGPCWARRRREGPCCCLKSRKPSWVGFCFSRDLKERWASQEDLLGPRVFKVRDAVAANPLRVF